MSVPSRRQGDPPRPLLPLLLLLLGTVSGRQDKDASRSLVRPAIPGYEWAKMYLPLGVSTTSPCGQALLHMLSSLTADNSTSWARHMVDSWGKTNDGILFGNINYLGMFEECLSAASPDAAVMGKYCRIKIVKKETGSSPMAGHAAIVPLNLDLLRTVGAGSPGLANLLMDKELRTASDGVKVTGGCYGTCMPDVCTREELEDSLNQFLTSDFTSTVFPCSVQDSKPAFDNSDIGFMSLLAFLLGMIVCASLVDMYLDYTGNTRLTKGVVRYLLVFSAYTNLSKMFQLSPIPSPGTITCLHGMRVLSMTWVVYAHQQSVNFYSQANLMDVAKWTDGVLAQTIANGFASVDTFFFFSGLLVSYGLLRQAKRTGSFNVGLYYFHRLLRLIPPIGLVAGIDATVMRFFASGPFFDVMPPLCRDRWWVVLLFVNNFVESYCLGHTWYIAVDTQLYLIAPLLILPLYFYRAAGKAWLFVVTLLTAIIPAAIIYVYDLPPISMMNTPWDESLFFMKNVYLKPWCRAGPWVAGIWLGYIFFRQGNSRVKMSPLMVAVGWTVAAVTGLLLVYGLASYNSMANYEPYEVMTQVVYGGMHTLVWGLVLVWVIFACHNGYGGVVNEFLSHPVWQPISRLTYTMYLVAFPLQFLIAYSARVSPYYNYVNKIIDTVGALVISLPVAVLVSLMAESPIMGLERILLRPSGPRPQTAPREEKPATDSPSSPLHPKLSLSTPNGAEALEKASPALAGLHNAAFTLEEGGDLDQEQGEKGSSEEVGVNRDLHKEEHNTTHQDTVL